MDALLLARIQFGMGVVSGLVIAYQSGTHWSEFSRFARGITGALLTYEVLTAFFLEAGFLCVMLSMDLVMDGFDHLAPWAERLVRQRADRGTNPSQPTESGNDLRGAASRQSL